MENNSGPRIFAVANMKGGVGKTTTSINLAACLADMGKRTLVVDMDPQANATSGLGITPADLEHSLYDIIMNEVSFEDCVEGTSVKDLFILPASQDLAGAEVELVNAFSRESRLKNALQGAAAGYDYIFIDCPPSLGILTVNALSFATEVIVPVQCEYFALEGLGQLLQNVDLVKKHVNPQLKLRYIVLVMYDGRTKLAGQVEEEVRAQFGERVCERVVPRSVTLAEAPKQGIPITVYDPSSKGTRSYRDVAYEINQNRPLKDNSEMFDKTALNGGMSANEDGNTFIQTEESEHGDAGSTQGNP